MRHTARPRRYLDSRRPDGNTPTGDEDFAGVQHAAGESARVDHPQRPGQLDHVTPDQRLRNQRCKTADTATSGGGGYKSERLAQSSVIPGGDRVAQSERANNWVCYIGRHRKQKGRY